MRIVQLVTNLDFGGMERLIVDLAECQLAAGHEPFIYCLTHPGNFAAEAEKKGICVRAFEKPAGPHLATVRHIARQLRQDRADVLHTHNHLVHHYGVAAAVLGKIPVIVNTRHGVERHFVSRPEGSFLTTKPKSRKADLIFRATLPWVDCVVLVSQATRRFFVDHRGIPERKTRVILNGARLERFFAVPASPGSVRPRIRFGTAARIVREKDHFTLLRAFASVVAQIPQAELLIAGDGPLKNRMEAFARELGLGNSVVYLGSQSNTPQFLAQLDVFVLSSLTEGLPISILEAMAAGLPIVSTRAGGVAEAASENQNAYFVDPADTVALADAMIRMARRTDLAQMGALGKKIVQDRFRIEDTWQQYHQLFLELRAKAK